MKVNLYKRISRSYWERWQWELQQWRQSVMQDRMIRSRAVSSRFQLSHPYVPYLFGVATQQQPYKIVMQFEGIANDTTTLTLNDAILN